MIPRSVIVYYIDIDDEKEIQQFIHDNNDTGVEIELRDLKNVLDNVVMDDKAEFTVAEVQPDGECSKSGRHVSTASSAIVSTEQLKNLT